MILFSNHTNPIIPPSLKLGSETLTYSTSAKFLGLIFDSKLTWIQHLTQLKTECQKLLGIMKMISSQRYGAMKDSLIQIYRTYIRAKLDYGSVIYCSANQRELSKLDVVTNDALRIATGAFKSTRIDSLYALCAEPKLSERREELALRYYLKLRASLRNPANKCIVNRNEQTFRNAAQNPFFVRISNIKQKYNLPTFFIRPEFSYRFNDCNTPLYAFSKPIVNKCMEQYPKSTTPPVIFKNLFLELLNNQYKDFKHIYTDGSKSSQGTGAAAITTGAACVASLPTNASIFSAEAHAVQMAVDFAARTYYGTNNNANPPGTVIFTDSRSVIQALEHGNEHPTIRYIAFKLHQLSGRATLELCWVPSHVGIMGNDMADEKAKDASKKRPN